MLTIPVAIAELRHSLFLYAWHLGFVKHTFGTAHTICVHHGSDAIKLNLYSRRLLTIGLPCIIVTTAVTAQPTGTKSLGVFCSYLHLTQSKSLFSLVHNLPKMLLANMTLNGGTRCGDNKATRPRALEHHSACLHTTERMFIFKSHTTE
jgi:hypothetical protein